MASKAKQLIVFLLYVLSRNTISQNQQHDYIFVTHSLSWSEAENYCMATFETHLASVTNSEELNRTAMYTEAAFETINDVDHTAWIGLHDNYQEGVFTFSDNSTYENTYWASASEPNGAYSENCVEIYEDGKWNDKSCSTQNPFLCNAQKRQTINPSYQYTMIEVDTAYKCATLTDNNAVVYDIDYNECLQQCLDIYNNECVMIDFIMSVKTSSDSRCYIFDRPCDIIADADSNHLIAIKGFNDICFDFPMDWSDTYDDGCTWYSTYNFCANGSIHDNITVDVFTTHYDDIYGLNAIQTCCECGGGLNVFHDITLQFAASMNFSTLLDNDVQCNWSFNDINQFDHLNVPWDDFILYDLCIKLKDKVYNNLMFVADETNMEQHKDDIKCETFIDPLYIGDESDDDVILCDFEHYNSNEDDLYFIAMFANDINKTSYIYLNSYWFNISETFSHNGNIRTLTSDECITSLTSKIDSIFYGILPCDINTESPTFEPTMNPTSHPTITQEYTLIEESLSWEDAEHYCLEYFETHLATITGDKGYELSAYYVNDVGNDLWIGLNDINQEGEFVWSDGNPLTTSYWDSNEPNGESLENCVEVYATGNWNDVSCTDEKAFLCNAPSSEVTNHTTINDDGIDDDMKHKSDNVWMVLMVLSLVTLFVAVLLGKQYYFAQKRKVERLQSDNERVQIEMDRLKSKQTYGNTEAAPFVSSTGGECILCCNRAAHMFNYPCGHVSYCFECSKAALNNDTKCPSCRQQIKECKAIYFSGFKPDHRD